MNNYLSLFDKNLINHLKVYKVSINFAESPARAYDFLSSVNKISKLDE